MQHRERNRPHHPQQAEVDREQDAEQQPHADEVQRLGRGPGPGPERSHSGDPGRHPAGTLGRLRRLERRDLRVPDQAAQVRGATHQRQRDDGEQQDGSEDAASRTGEPARLPQADPGNHDGEQHGD